MRHDPAKVQSAIAAVTIACAAFAFASTIPGWAEEREDSPAELVQIGRRVYHQGRIASGEPVKALVLGDVPVEGSQFTCLHCHRHSGLGGSEGRIRVLPTNGAALFHDRVSIYRSRPAYTDASLARLIRSGVDSAGQPLDSLMPKYELPDFAMSALIAYLKTLSSEYSPGVTEEQLHLATVVAGDINPVHRSAMLDVLESFFAAKNGQTRAEVRRARVGPFYHEYKNKAYRKWTLHVWEIQGPESIWRQQLEEKYRRQPVFAMVSGITALGWQPVHEFCEDMEIPCLLPNIDAPPAARDEDFYNLYFSKGVSLEAELIAHRLERKGGSHNVLQVYRRNSPGGVAAATLRAWAARSRRADVIDMALAKEQLLSQKHLDREILRSKVDTLVFWLDSTDLGLPELACWHPQNPIAIYLSSTLLNEDLSVAPAAIKNSATLVHPFTLPEDFEERMVREHTWFKTRGIDSTPETLRIEIQTYFACRVLGEGLMHIKRYFYRDYLMDSIDHLERMGVFTALYPRLSFGPGQRYLAKGGYLIDLIDTQGKVPAGKAVWIVP